MREKRKAKKGQNDFDVMTQARVRNHTLTSFVHKDKDFELSTVIEKTNSNKIFPLRT